MRRGIASALAVLLLALGVAIASTGGAPDEPRPAEDRPLVAPVETNPCSVAGACW
jgi:hypothetical protein